ncbi:hypothetical protein KI429_27145 [Pseudomonas shirazica]|nr:hypothetical protein KI429_27145 [Pseudomonas shirazica]
MYFTELKISAKPVGAALAAKRPAAITHLPALQQGTLHIAITPEIRRQKIDTPSLIAKRHKTVRSFFDEFFKIFFDAGIKISRNSFALYISGQNPECYQIEIVRH